MEASLNRRGYLYGFATVAFYCSFMLVTRYGASRSALAPIDLAFLRFLFAGLFFVVLAFIRRDRSALSVPWPKALALAFVMGPVYILLVAWGMIYGTASDAAVVINGSMVLASAGLSIWFLTASFRGRKALGLALLLLGLVLATNGNFGGGRGLSYALFAAGGVLWACYAVLVKLWQLDGWTAATLANVLPALTFVPVVAVLRWNTLTTYSPSLLLFHGVFQGVLIAGIAMVLFSRTVEHLGAPRASSLMPLVPCLTAVLSAFILGEAPAAAQIAGLGLVVGGIFASR